MSSEFREDDERLWMSNGAAELHVLEWQAKLAGSAERESAEAKALDAFFTEHLEAAGPGTCGFDVNDGPLAHDGVRRLFASLVVAVAQDIVDAAVGLLARESLAFLATHEPAWKATWVSWQRVFVEWMKSELPSAELRIPEPLASANRAIDLYSIVRTRFRRRTAGEAPPADELEARRELCALLLEVTNFLGAALPRAELLALADVEEALGYLEESADTTRAAAELHDDPRERAIALDIAAGRAAKAVASR